MITVHPGLPTASIMPAEVAEAGGDQREDRVDRREDGVRARVRDAVHEHVHALGRRLAPGRIQHGLLGQRGLSRLVDGAGEDPARMVGIGEERVDLEDALAEAGFQVVPHLVEHGVHAVSVHRHRHAIGRVGHADRPPGGEPDADRLPASGEAADVVGVDVDGEVRLGDEAVHLDGVAVLGRDAEVGDRVGILGVVADEAPSELGDQVVAEEPAELRRPEHAVQRVGADQRDVPAPDAGALQLVEDGPDRHRPDGAERAGGVVVEGDGHRPAGADEGADSRHAERRRQRVADGGVEVGDGRQRGAFGVGQETSVRRQLGGDGGLAIGQVDSHGWGV